MNFIYLIRLENTFHRGCMYNNVINLFRSKVWMIFVLKIVSKLAYQISIHFHNLKKKKKKKQIEPNGYQINLNTQAHE